MSIALNRNNTNFSIQAHEYLKSLDFSTEDQKKYSFLKLYQNLVREYVNQVKLDARGLLIYWTMGLGKTLSIVSIAMDQLDRGRQVIILLTKSLQENLRKDIRKYIKLRTAVDPLYKLGTLPENDLERYIDKNFAFVSMNASNMIKQMMKAVEGSIGKEFAVLDSKLNHIVSSGTLDHKIVLVDEAQNLFRAITNGSKNAKEFYNMVIASRDCRIFFFSGTPISSSPFELISCFNMLGSSQPGKLLFPESYSDFYKFFVDKNLKTIANKGKFQNRIFGLVSHVTHESPIAKGIGGKTVEFPKEFPIVVERVPMDSEQFVIYQLARDKEADEGKYGTRGDVTPAPMTKPKKEFASSYKQKSRQLSNYCPPPAFRDKRFSSIDVYSIPDADATSAKIRRIYNNIEKHQNQLGFVYSQFVGAGGLGILQRFLELRGWRIHRLQSSLKRVLAKEDIKDSETVDDSSQSPLQSPLQPPLQSPLQPPPHDTPILESRDDNTTPENEQSVDTTGAHERIIMSGKRECSPMEIYIREFDPILKYIEKTSGIHGGSERPNRHKNIQQLKKAAETWKHFITPEILKSDHLHNDDVHGGDMQSHQRRTFAVISGIVDTELRQRIQDIFNSDENKHGGVIDLLLISSTGAEGLDLKNVRHIHIMEPYWNYSRINQIKARGVRNDSHISLDPSERNVQPYIYLAVRPDDLHQRDKRVLLEKRVSPEDLLTTDEELYIESLNNQTLVESFLTAIKEVSIECQMNNPTGYKCRVCNPTNNPLFYDDIDLDMKTEDKCVTAEMKTVKATEIRVNGIKYYYAEDPSSLYGWRVYEYDEFIKGIREMRQDIPLYMQIVEAIENQKK